MPLDVLGCTRATLIYARGHSRLRRRDNLERIYRAGDSLLEFLNLNEELLVSVRNNLPLITSLPFVHTARRSYRLSYPVNHVD
jgi:hypothetical protein